MVLFCGNKEPTLEELLADPIKSRHVGFRHLDRWFCPLDEHR